MCAWGEYWRVYGDLKEQRLLRVWMGLGTWNTFDFLSTVMLCILFNIYCTISLASCVAPIYTSKMLIIQTKHARWICNTTIERRRLNYISSLSLMCADTMFWTWIMLDGWIESIIIHSSKGGWHGQVYAAYSFLHLSISIVLLVRYKRLGDTKLWGFKPLVYFVPLLQTHNWTTVKTTSSLRWDYLCLYKWYFFNSHQGYWVIIWQ